MHNPLVIVRFALFSILVCLNILALGFAGWQLAATRNAGLHVSGSPIFAIFNACVVLLFIALASAELVSPNAKSGQINFECGWTCLMSALQLSCAIDVIVNGPPVYCRAEEYKAICASSTVLSAITWTSSILMSIYFLTLFYLALAHSSVYGAIWHTTIYHAPWFIDPVVRMTAANRLPKMSYEPELGGVLRGQALESTVVQQSPTEVPTTPPPAPSSQDPRLPRSSLASSRPRSARSRVQSVENARPRSEPTPARSVESLRNRSAPSPARSVESLRPVWAKRMPARRAVDVPFPQRPVEESYWSGPTAPPSPVLGAGPSSSLPDLSQFVLVNEHLPDPLAIQEDTFDRSRASYDEFPDAVPDEDKPIEQPGTSAWVQARR